ncbi:MAG: dihydrofolate reductase family protein [Lachnospiraceae bacterium]
MRKVILFIAISLDGYIADSNSGVGWLDGQGNDNENIDTYSEFVKDIDTILMGWNTYHQVVTELSPTEWIYGDFTTYVITHNKGNSNEQILFTDESPINLLEKLKRKNGKDIWICGGANLVQQLMCASLINRYYISIIPTLLGKGIRLFGEFPSEQKLSLVQTRNYNGIVELIYENR